MDIFVHRIWTNGDIDIEELFFCLKLRRYWHSICTFKILWEVCSEWEFEILLNMHKYCSSTGHMRTSNTNKPSTFIRLIPIVKFCWICSLVSQCFPVQDSHTHTHIQNPQISHKTSFRFNIFLQQVRSRHTFRQPNGTYAFLCMCCVLHSFPTSIVCVCVSLVRLWHG